MTKKNSAIFGSFLVVVGMLIMFVSGTCSAMFSHSMFFPEVLVIGGIPFVLGCATWLVGRRLITKGQENNHDESDPDMSE